jgi:putative tricarboxylic transport membrane protein
MRRHDPVAILCVVLVSTIVAQAQSSSDVPAGVLKLKPVDFPNRSIELMVANPAGGGMDVNGRLFAKYLDKYLGQPTVVNNRVGAGGFVGYQWFATQAPHDGSVIGFIGTSILADSFLRAKGKWNYRDIEPIAFVNYEPTVWLTSSTGSYRDKSLEEIVRIAKEEPETVRVAIASNAMFESLAEQIELVSGAKFIRVPFGGDAPARQALLGNHIDVSFGFIGSARGDIESGNLKIIAVTGDTRLAEYKDVPTFNEILKQKTIHWLTLRYVGIPKGMAEDRKAFLTAAAQAAATDPELAADFKRISALRDKPLDTPEAVAAEVDRLAEIERQFYVETGRMK